jgi:hypothetical protein
MGEGASRRNRRYRLVEPIIWGRLNPIIRLADRSRDLSADKISDLRRCADCGKLIAPHNGEFEPDCLCHPRNYDALRVRIARDQHF